MKSCYIDYKNNPAFTVLLISVFLLPLVFCFKTENTFELPKLAVLIFTTGLIFCVWIFQSLKRNAFSLIKSPLSLPILIYLVAHLISTVNSANKIQSFGAIFNLSINIVLFFAVLHIIQTKKQLNTLIWVLFCSGLVQALFGAMQYCDIDPLFSSYISKATLGTYAMIGTLGYRNYLAGFLILLFPLSLFLVYKHKALLVKVCIIGLSIFLITTGCYMWTHKVKIITTEMKQSEIVKRRLLIWKAAFTMGTDSPIIGVGSGMFKVRYLEYLGIAHGGKITNEAARLSENVKEAHNEYLQTFAELGIIGLGSFLLIILMLFREIIIKLRLIADKSEKALLLSASMSFIMILIISIFSFPLRVIPTAQYFWILVSAVMASIHLNRPYRSKEYKITKAKCVFTILGIGVLALTSIASAGLLSSDIRFAKARFLSEQGYIQSAIAEYEKMPLRLRYDPRLRFHYGSALIVSGRVPDGIQVLENTKSGYSDINLYTNLGKAYLEANKFEDSMRQYEFAVKTGIKYEDNLNNIGVVFLKQGQVEKAKKQFKKAGSIYPKSYASKFNLGLAFMKTEDYQLALKSFLEAGQIALTPEVYNMIAVCYIRTNDMESAIGYLLENLNSNDEDIIIQAHNNLGAIYAQMNEKDKAIEHWKKVLQYDSNNEIALKNR